MTIQTQTHPVSDDVFRQVYDSSAALPGCYKWLTTDEDVRQIEKLLDMPQKTIGAPLWVSGDRKRCTKWRRGATPRRMNIVRYSGQGMQTLHQPDRRPQQSGGWPRAIAHLPEAEQESIHQAPDDSRRLTDATINGRIDLTAIDSPIRRTTS